jgi:hypothetical protein
MITTKQILRAIGNANLSLYKGDGYWYFVYDDKGDLYDDLSVYTMRLNDLPLSSWVEDGRALISKVENV